MTNTVELPVLRESAEQKIYMKSRCNFENIIMIYVEHLQRSLRINISLRFPCRHEVK